MIKHGLWWAPLALCAAVWGVTYMASHLWALLYLRDLEDAA